MSTTQRIGILNSGGATPGTNAVIDTFVKASPLAVRGYKRGFEGILDNDYIDFDPHARLCISHQPGTILGTTNHGRFAAKVGEGKKNQIDHDLLIQTKERLEADGIDGLIVIGGDGTLSAAHQLAESGVKLIGIPKTMDNDLAATDKTFGFDTAVEEAVEYIDKLRPIAESQARTFIVELMGRDAGWVTLYAAAAVDADVALLPEVQFQFSEEKLISILGQKQAENEHGTLVVVSEGVSINGHKEYQKGTKASESVLGGVSHRLAQMLSEKAPDLVEVRANSSPGHILRGRAPIVSDRLLASSYALKGMQALQEGYSDYMVAWRNGRMTIVPLGDAVGYIKHVTPSDPVYRDAVRKGIEFCIA